MKLKEIDGYTIDKRKGYVRNNIKYIPYKEPIPYLLVKNYFSENDMVLLLDELKFLTPKMTYQEPKDMPDGTKQNNQINLDSLYKDRKTSNILNTLDKIYDDKKLIETLKDMSWFYTVWGYTNIDNSFVAYYENTDYYKAHRDISIISIMYWLWEEPKSFTGGNVHLTDYDIEIPLERNQLMIMPSSTNHAVDPIKMIDNNKKLSGMGRYCIVRFLKLN